MPDVVVRVEFVKDRVPKADVLPLDGGKEARLTPAVSPAMIALIAGRNIERRVKEAKPDRRLGRPEADGPRRAPNGPGSLG
jgi:hypothetical protein